MGASSAAVENANLRGQIDGMDRGMNRMQGIQSNFFNQNSSFMSGFGGAFMGSCCANMMNCFRGFGGGGGGFGFGGGGFGRSFGW
jgi:hypothetical protein